MNTKKIKSSWELFFGTDSMLNLTDEERCILNEEYSLLPSDATISSRQVSNCEDWEAEDFAEGYENDNRPDTEQPMPLCCEKNCMSLLTPAEITGRQSSVRQMSKREQDICILSHLVSGRISANKGNIAKGRVRFVYRFDNNRTICRKAFLFIYGIKSGNRLKRIQKLAASNILIPAVHSNTGNAPVHALQKNDVDKVMQFVMNYAAIHGLPDPGRLRRNTREILLPSSDSYTSVWEVYKTGIQKEENQQRSLSYNSFRTIWKKSLPHIRFKISQTDLCDHCEEFKNNIKYATSQKSVQKFIDDYNQHRDRTDAARQIYNQQIDKAKDCWQAMPEETRKNILSNLSDSDICIDQKPCTRNINMHYSFDFAQQVVYPYSNQQRGKEYFKTARKCQIFGICAEALPRQVFFLIDESEFFGKGSRTVISLLDAYFRLHGIGEKEANLHADNCTGQNKNNYVIWYLMWRVMNGLHKRITLSFMIPGHTKFAPDRYFGLFKIKYRRSTTDCLQDLIMCVNNCTAEQTVAQVYGRHLGLEKNAFEYSKWDEYLSSYFKTIDGILRYNFFSFDHEEPGVVGLRVNPDDKPSFVNILKEKYHRFQLPAQYPPVALPTDLDLERKMYLYKEIRQFVRDPQKRDLTCPFPKKGE